MKRQREQHSQANSNWNSFRKKVKVHDASQLRVAASSFAAAEHSQQPHGSVGDTASRASPAAVVVASTGASSGPVISEGPKEEAVRTVRGPWDASVSAHSAKYIALDCEMVGVGAGGERSVLAHVVAVDWSGKCVYSSYVKPKEQVTDYRTAVSGVLPKHLASARPFPVVQREVSDLLRGKVLVGHGLHNDLKALLLQHPWTDTRDTATYKPFCRTGRDGRSYPRKLALLVQEMLGVSIQAGNHDPAEDARAALALYKLKRREWEHGLMGRSTVAKHGAGSR